jgi:hypothetical protein
MAVRLSALRAGRPLTPQEDSWYAFLLDAESTGLGQFKNRVTSSGLEPATLLLVAKCLNQLLYRVPTFINQYSIIFLLYPYVTILFSTFVLISLTTDIRRPEFQFLKCSNDPSPQTSSRSTRISHHFSRYNTFNIGECYQNSSSHYRFG